MSIETPSYEVAALSVTADDLNKLVQQYKTLMSLVTSNQAPNLNPTVIQTCFQIAATHYYKSLYPKIDTLSFAGDLSIDEVKVIYTYYNFDEIKENDLPPARKIYFGSNYEEFKKAEYDGLQRYEDFEPIQSITLPQGVKSVHIHDCSIKEISIPEGVTELVIKQTEESWDKISHLQIPQGVKNIDINTSAATSIHLPEGAESIKLIECGRITEIEIPANTTDAKIVECDRLETIEVGLGVKSIVVDNCCERPTIHIEDPTTTVIQK